MKLKISTIEHESHVNGPGTRAVVWLQGCSIGRSSPCKNCFNAHTWPINAGREIETEDLARELNSLNVRGITFSGGEPMDQAEVLIELICQLNRSFDIMVFSGFTLDEINKDKNKTKLLDYIDLLKTGRYDTGLQSNESKWRGSSNQELHYLTNKIHQNETSDSRVEVTIKTTGKLTMTGFPSPEFIKDVKNI